MNNVDKTNTEKGVALFVTAVFLAVVLLDHVQHAILKGLSTQGVWHYACAYAVRPKKNTPGTARAVPVFQGEKWRRLDSNLNLRYGMSSSSASPKLNWDV